MWRNITLVGLLALLACAPKITLKKPAYDYTGMDKNTIQVHKQLQAFLETTIRSRSPVVLPPTVRIDSLVVDAGSKHIRAVFSKPFSYPAYRPEQVQLIYELVRKQLGRKYRAYQISLNTIGQPLQELVPNFYRTDSSQYDTARFPAEKTRPAPLVQSVSRLSRPAQGLLHCNIDLRPSHGWYFNRVSNRWEWQRPRMFQTVEDLLPYSVVVPYLLPMLENAGATVFMPRERDVQTAEVIVDNDAGPGYSEHSGGAGVWFTNRERGFSLPQAPFAASVNPFFHGTSRQVAAQADGACVARWLPNIPRDGDYAVYVTYVAGADRVSEARYSVLHSGGRSEFLVNQQIGGSTWIYLGRFRFRQGEHPQTGAVLLSNAAGTAGRWISADAVRFGGGLSSSERGGYLNTRPRFSEGSKYYLHYLGFPDTLVHNLYQGQDDYRDDYVSRSEFANYLYGAPFGPKKNRQTPGLGIPIDLSMAIHTDAGITRSDTTIGTLAIYSVQDADSNFCFPDQVSRLTNRDFADVVQTQIVADLSKRYDPKWNRRALLDGLYAEVVRPNMPSVLIELLSHQNFLDMSFALDPRFRFDIARALYKGMLRYNSFQHRRPCVVQPLPVTHLCITNSSVGEWTLAWRPQEDPLEPSADADYYIVYSRRNDQGFDNGTKTEHPFFVVDHAEPGTLYSFKVTAVNEGGESFSSEVVSFAVQAQSGKPVLVVNGFDRICGPQPVSQKGFSGFMGYLDQGVADRYTVNYTGLQIDFDPGSVFRNNDAPGHGASQADYETRLISGNTFDFIAVHGRAILNAGYSFVSSSDEAVTAGLVSLADYAVVDLILGEEKETSWPKAGMDSLRGTSFKAIPAELQRHITDYFKQGGRLFASGAYIGSDLMKGKKTDHEDVLFGRQSLKFDWTADHAAVTGSIAAVDTTLFPKNFSFRFNTVLNDSIYAVEAPDAIDPFEGSRTILRYSENQYSAAVAFRNEYGVVVLGFPFEAILGAVDRDRVMRAVLDYLGM